MDEKSEKRIAGEAEKIFPTVELNALLRRMIGNIEELVKKTKPKALAPMLVAFLAAKEPNGRRMELPVALSSFPGGGEKREMLHAVGAKLAGDGMPVVACFLLSEAWLKMMSPAEGWRAKGGIIQPPSECPDRVEAAVLWGRTIDGRACMAYARLEHGNGGVLELGKWETMECEAKGGSVQNNLLSHLFAGYLMGMAKRMGKGKG